MENLDPIYKVSLLKQQCETHSMLSGFWNVETIQAYFDEVNEVSMPFVKDRSPIYALVDFTDFVAQDRDTTAAIRDHLLTAQKFGLKRVAIFGASTLVRTQYRRLSQGVNVEFFETKAEALNWLRENREPHASAA
ncbi:STAS/SEC14 domain-containing protein [Qipengyuania sp. DGS5-3]|uniref:STAS/SEC14 domain-containing protein n=1 Tax=Qipengyuania sp. DGS5-3 TaxID=3349632 RepID=UPI0036D20AE5